MKFSRDLLSMTATVSGAILIAFSGCAPHAPRQYHLVPAPGEKYEVESGGVRVRSNRFLLSLLPLDDLGRASFIKSRAPGSVDPFSPGPAGIDRYFTFKVSVENTGEDGPVVFQPQSVFLASEQGDRLFPLDFPEAYRLLFGKSNSDPRLLDDLSKYMFDVGVSVDPGKRAEGLLIYPVGNVTAHRLRMGFTFMSTTGEPNDYYDIFFTQERRN